jgi:hypothetical protein
MTHNADRGDMSEMKRAIIVSVLILAVCAGVFAEGSVVTLQNQESSTFYYVIDAAALAGLSPGSPLLAARVADFFAAPGDDPAFASLAPDAQVKLTSLADGPHLLVGFFAVEGQDQFPVRVISLQADSRIGERFYAIYADPSLISADRGTGRLARFASASQQTAAAAPAADSGSTGTAATPEAGTETAAAPVTAGVSPTAPQDSTSGLPTIATFAPTYDPVVFTRESKGAFTVLPIASSRAWALPGTRITALAGDLENGALRLSLSVAGGFSENVSYFFYIFASRADKENRIALELRPAAAGRRGACLLWEKGAAAPRIIGTVRRTDTSVELDVDPGQLSTELAGGSGDAPTVDLTAGWYDRGAGTWEEFYYTTFSAADIAVTR